MTLIRQSFRALHTSSKSQASLPLRGAGSADREKRPNGCKNLAMSAEIASSAQSLTAR
jgi:hypothetical protein